MGVGEKVTPITFLSASIVASNVSLEVCTVTTPIFAVSDRDRTTGVLDP